MLAGPGTAHAYTSWDQLTPAQKQAAAELLERGGALSRTPTCGPTCSDLWLSEHRPMPNQTSSKQLHRELLRARIKAGFLPRLVPVLGTVALGATAFELGWTIGTGARKQWLKIHAPASPPTGLTGADPIGWVWGTTDTYKLQAFNAGTRPAHDTSFELPPVIPFDYYQLQNWSNSGSNSNMAQDYPCVTPALVAPNLTSLGYFQYAFKWSECVMPGGGPRVAVAGNVYISYAEDLTPEAPVDYVGGAGQPSDKLSPAPTDPGAAPAHQKAKDELATGSYPTVVQWVSAHTGDDETDPAGQLARVPLCRGLTYAECATELEIAGFTVTPTKVVFGFDGADITLPADAVVSTTPAHGSQVDTDTAVTVRVNPAPADMPVLVPAVLAGETADEYLARLTALGLGGRVVELTDATLDPTKGPREITKVEPATGTKVHAGSEVVVTANPETAPDPTPGGVGGPPGACGPTVPALNFDPLRVPIAGTFPFGVFGWIAGVLGGWTGGAADVPVFTFPMPGSIDDLTVDLESFADPIMSIVRPVLLVVAVLGLMWLFASSAMGFGRGGGD